MSKSSYPFPGSPDIFASVHARQLFPLREPPVSHILNPPALPREAHERVKELAGSAVFGDFALSTHIVPSAYPRVAPLVSSLGDRSNVDCYNSNDASKRETRTNLEKVAKGIMSLKEHHIQGEFPTNEREDRLLWNCVNRYYRTSAFDNKTRTRAKSVTLILTHANGYSKETWEPFLRQLAADFQNSENGQVSVDEVWAFDAVAHGDSSLINQGRIGILHDWSDEARDILNFLIRYLPRHQASIEGTLPLYLPRVPSKVERTRLRDGFAGDRTLVSIGHSYGGAVAALAAATLPQLFSALILVEPIIVPPYIDISDTGYNFALGAIQKRHEWPSREEARRTLSRSPFFRAWDAEVLDNYVKFGLASILSHSEGVQLKMPGIQEAAIYADTRSYYEAFEQLKDLDLRIPLHTVMSGKGRPILKTEGAIEDLVWRRPINSTNTQISASGHLIVQQEPKELAHDVHACLKRLFGRQERARL